MRVIKDLNAEWGFYKGDLNQEKRLEENGMNAGDGPGWEIVDLPHTWNALDGQDGGNDYYQGVAWYRKSFMVQEGFKEIYVRFGAVNKLAQVWCNGQLVGEHRGGFSAFAFDLTPFLREGENELFVKANNSNELPIYPRQADFTFFGGIYRGVELICFSDAAHFDVERFGCDAIFVTPFVDGRVEVDAYALGGGSSYAQIYDAEGNCVARSQRSDGGRNHFTLHVPGVKRWNGTKDAYLYRLKVFLCGEKEEPVDETACLFGFREFTVDADKGFFLNGESYALRGVSRHQDRENMGWAITEREHLEDMALIREMGANTVRLAHYQQAPFFYDLCDRNGMVVWAEIPFISAHDERKEADDNLREQLKELVLQNYNHPSICFWGIANEIGIGGETEAMYGILKELNQLAKELDPIRLTAIANVSMTKTGSPLFHITDVTAYNEYNGWYEGTADDHGIFCDEKHGQIPEIPLAISEYGAEGSLAWHSEKPGVKDYTEEYQALLHEKAEKAFEARPYLWATWLWNMFDFAADAREEGGCRGRNNKGLVTYDRKIRKQAFYYYKACWSKEPFIYLCGKRFTKHVDEKVNIKVYSNLQQVELWVNGELSKTLSGSSIFEFQDVELTRQFNEILVKTPEGLTDSLVLERVEQFPEEYILKETKNISEAVTQWFANIISHNPEAADNKELVVKEGFLSVYDPMEEVYRYPEGFQLIQELVAKPLAIQNPAMASRMDKGGPMSFAAIWHHINKMLPDELIYVVNERLNKIKKQ